MSYHNQQTCKINLFYATFKKHIHEQTAYLKKYLSRSNVFERLLAIYQYINLPVRDTRRTAKLHSYAWG